MKTEQKLLDGKGTVEDLQKGIRMFQALAEVFTRPIIGHTAWADSITAEQKARIEVERMKQIAEAKGEKITEATDYEAMIYIMTASPSAPLDRTHQKIYFHLFKRFYPDKSDFIPDHEANIEGDLLAERDLIRLKRWLYKTSKKR